MPYIPHTEEDIRSMLQTVGCERLEDLFRDVPDGLLLDDPISREAINEYELTRFFEDAAAENRPAAPGRLFLGAGAYRHYIPAAVKTLMQRGEFVTCYTPYQAEVSQGTLQAVFEFQSHICALTGMEVANASMYDGATALAEAILMAARVNKGDTVLVPSTLHPAYRAVLDTHVRELGIAVAEVPGRGGLTDWGAAPVPEGGKVAAVVVQTPNFLGLLEDGHGARALADRTGGLLVAACNPMALAVIEPPGDFGADIAVGEAQPLGIPLQYGGPYAGYFATREKYVRQMPGRLVGRTTDAEGREGFVLTLQTREQHIRRERATSNICTNQGLFALMVTMYLTFTGRQGLVEVAETCAARAHELAARLAQETPAGLASPDAPFFNEFVLALPLPAAEFIAAMREDAGIVAGLDLARHDGGTDDRLLVCATELNSPADIDAYVAAAARVLADRVAAVGA